jgi:hypothetical protein
MITRAYRALLNRLRTVSVYQYSEKFVDCERIETLSASGTKNLCIIPITPKHLKYLPEGVYTLQDKKFYEVGSGTIAEKSIIQITETDKYRVNQIDDRYLDGGFTVYLGKKETV